MIYAMKNRCIGRFFVSRRMLHNNPDKVHRMMKDILIVEATNSFHRDGIEYTGISNIFPPQGDTVCTTPEYEIYIEIKRYPDKTEIERLLLK